MIELKPPSHLSDESKRIWKSLMDEYELSDEAGTLLLTTAMEARDRMKEAQAIVTQDGAKILDRFGQAKAHPIIAIERDSRTAMLAALKQCNLDLEPLRDRPGRPGGR